VFIPILQEWVNGLVFGEGMEGEDVWMELSVHPKVWMEVLDY